MTAMRSRVGKGMGCNCMSARSGGGVGMGGRVDMSGGVGMGVCARSAFAKEEDGVVVEEEGGRKEVSGGGNLWISSSSFRVIVFKVSLINN